MTTINIDKLLLEQVQDLLYRVTRWKGESHEVLTDLHDIKEAVKAVLAAPASAPEPVAWMSPKRFYRTRAMALINGEQLIEPLYLYRQQLRQIRCRPKETVFAINPYILMPTLVGLRQKAFTVRFGLWLKA